ncbi:hypothetical protein [Nevskia sp.]|uniref:hypothetical protein n=1 Tax=Nevskia sp. TaxID=1929292 RepID=UPI0025E5DE5F|nr:hypothetical protein [Nevskia sp.]
MIVDVEPLYYMVTGQFPLHRLFHTYIGVSPVIAATVGLFAGALRLAAVVPVPDVFGWKQLTLRAVVIGAALGGYSHIVFDSIMHSDIRPLAPFSQSNALFQVVPLQTLHLSCIGAGALGLVVLGVRKMLRGKSDSAKR